MSKTIITKSGIQFITSINREQIIGTLCREVGAKFQDNKYCQDEYYADMAHEMTKEETLDAAKKLNYFYDKGDYILEKYHYFFSKDYKAEYFNGLLSEIIETLENSDGYECVW